MKTTADVIIIGGGNAGCALAYRLSERYSVIVLEAGTDLSDDSKIYTPSESGTLLNNVNKYFYPLGHSIVTPPSPVTRHPFPGVGGELIGGGSSVNGMQYVRGTTEYYQRWANFVNDLEWGPANVNEVFKRIEKFNGVPGNFNPTAHGFHGPLDVKQVVINEQAATVFVNAAATITGIPNNIDYNDFGNPLGSYIYWQVTQTPASLRASSFTAYLKSILYRCDSCDSVYRSRCTCNPIRVVVKARVQRINFEESKHCQQKGQTRSGCNSGCSAPSKHSGCSAPSQIARSVSAVVNGECIEFTARKHVIVTAGFQSASLLQLSGVGDINHLLPLCVPPVIHNPNVGQHMVNHPIFALTGVVTDGNPFTPLPANFDSQGLYAGGAQVASTTAPGVRAFQLIGIPNPVQVGVAPTTFTIAGLLLDAKSEGTIQINNSDPNRPPIFDFKYFTDPEDLPHAIEMYGIMYNILVEMGLSPLGPDPSDTPAVTAIFLAQFNQAYHWVGMTRMAASPATGVVDSNGKVFGSRNLYVADISVAPFNAAGNTQAVAYLVANIIADKLLRS